MRMVKIYLAPAFPTADPEVITLKGSSLSVKAFATGMVVEDTVDGVTSEIAWFNQHVVTRWEKQS